MYVILGNYRCWLVGVASLLSTRHLHSNGQESRCYMEWQGTSYALWILKVFMCINRKVLTPW